MQVIPIKTPILQKGDNIVDTFLVHIREHNITLDNGDVLVIAETPLSTVEGRTVNLSEVKPSSQAKKIAKKYCIEPEITELILKEADVILGGYPSLVLTLKNNTLLVNAGIDKSNAPPGHVSLLPKDPTASAKAIHKELHEKTKSRVGVIIADSRSQPLRAGLIGMAVGVHGFNPLIDDRGKRDLYGNQLQVTRRALADDLATTAQIVMGESDEQTPFVLIKGAPITLTEREIVPSELYVPSTECFYIHSLQDKSSPLLKTKISGVQTDAKKGR